jgi:hypothetical protein
VPPSVTLPLPQGIPTEDDIFTSIFLFDCPGFCINGARARGIENSFKPANSEID